MRLLTCLCIIVVALATAPTLLAGCDDTDVAPASTGDGGTGLANPPSRPITDKVTPPNPDEAPAPTLTKLDPAAAALGSIGPTVVFTGSGFVPRSVVVLDGQELDTTYQSDTELAATVPTEKLTDVGELEVTVRTPAPGGGESQALKFAVENPPPEIVALDPLSIVAGSGDSTITAVGTTFVAGSTIHFGTTDLVTTFVDEGHLKGAVPASALLVSASVPITVISPAPGGGTSTTIAFTISNPNASISTIAPDTAFVGSPDIQLSVKGTGFVAASVILFNGTALPTTPGAAGELKATIPASALTNVGDLPVAVQNPPPGGGVSAPSVLKVLNPLPTAASLAPASIPAGSGPTPVIVTGTGFVSSTKIMVETASVATTVTDATHVKATLTAVQLAKVGSVAIKVTTAGAGTSAPLTLAVPAGTPKITAIDGSTITVGAGDTTITVHGSLFIAASSASINGHPLTTAYANGGQLTAVIPAALLTSVGPLPVIVTNPATGGVGGGASAPQNVNVACESSNVNVLLADTTTTQSLQTNFATAPTLTRWASGGTCPNVPLSSPVVTKQPAQYAVVQNTTSAPVTLSAWADCTNDGKGAAFLTFYRRATPPANDTERLACENFVADGSAPYVSQDAAGSANCPGLMKSNGGGIALGVCERAVVHIQPFDNASSVLTPPPTLKIHADQ